MREDQVVKSLNFLLQKDETGKSKYLDLLKSLIVKEISFEEKKKFLEGKLTEEEIGEVMRRYNQAAKPKDAVFANVKESPIAETRL